MEVANTAMLTVKLGFRKLSESRQKSESMTHLTTAAVVFKSTAICGRSGTNVPATNTDSEKKNDQKL
jgi:hypothetical protein